MDLFFPNLTILIPLRSTTPSYLSGKKKNFKGKAIWYVRCINPVSRYPQNYNFQTQAYCGGWTNNPRLMDPSKGIFSNQIRVLRKKFSHPKKAIFPKTESRNLNLRIYRH